MICKKCGAEVMDNAIYCPKCGEKLKKKKHNKKAMIMVISIISVMLIIVGIYCYNAIPSILYIRGEKAYNQKEYDKAMKCYKKAITYKDSEEKYNDSATLFYYTVGKQKLENAEYEKAIEYLENVATYDDASDLILETHYYMALEYIEKLDYENALSEFKLSEYYGDSKKIITDNAEKMVQDGEYDTALSWFESINYPSDPYYQYAHGIKNVDKDPVQARQDFLRAGDILDAKQKVLESTYKAGNEQLKKEKYDEAVKLFDSIKEYSDSTELYNKSKLLLSKQLVETGKLNTAKTTLEGLDEDYTCDKVSVKNIKDIVENNKQWLSICGEWIAISGKASTTSYSTSVSWWYDGWTQDISRNNGSIQIRCVPQNDGTIKLQGDGTIYIYTNYSTITSMLCTDKYKFSFNKQVKDLGTIKIDDYVTMTISSNNIKVTYEKSVNEVSGFTYKYVTNCEYERNKEY